MNTLSKVVNANKITLVIFSFFLFSTNGFAQSVLDKTISFYAKEISIKDALLQVSTISETEITFSNRFFNQEKVTANFNDVPLQKVLERLLDNQPISYKLSGTRILLYKKKVQYHTLNGYIEDQISGERLIAATIYIPSLKRSAITNEYGFFSMKLPKGKVDLVCNYVGYDAQLLSLELNSDIQKDIKLVLTNTLEEIIVTPDLVHDSDIFASSYTKASENITQEMVSLTPQIGGVTDPIRTTQLLAGVQSGTDGLGGVYVRGGDSGHNSMMLDGVSVYIPYHLFGIFSVYNQDIVKSTKLFKGSFPAFYGGSLASVFDIRTKEGNQYRWTGNVSSNLVNLGAMIEGPLKKGKSSLMLAGRMAHSDFLFNPFFKRTYFSNRTQNISSFFYDVNAKWNYTFSNKDRVYASFYQGRDNVEGNTEREAISEEWEYEEELKLSWKNTIFSLRWNHLFNERFFANTTFTYSFFDHQYALLNEFYYENEEEEEDEDFYYLDFYSNNNDMGIKTDFDYIASPHLHLRFGGGVSYKRFIPALTYVDDEDGLVENQDSIDIDFLEEYREAETLTAISSNLYLENQIQFNPQLQANIGLRASSFMIGDNHYFRLEPRIFLAYQAHEKLGLRAAVNKMVQYLHLITLTNVRLPNDLWMPTNDEFTPQESWQGELGLDVYLSENTTLSFDAYTKTMKSLFAFSDDYTLEESTEFTEYLERGQGISRGLECTLNYQKERQGFQVSYAYTSTKRQFETINGGKAFRHSRDLPHQLKIFAYQKIGKGLSCSLNWIYHSGGPSISVNALNDLQFYNPGSRENDNSLKDYHRLDVNLNYEFTTRQFSHSFNIGVYNLYNRQNIAHYRVSFDNDNDLFIPSYAPVYGLGLRPSLSYKLMF